MTKHLLRLHVLISLAFFSVVARADSSITINSIINAAHNGTDRSLSAIGYLFGFGNGVNFTGGGRFEEIFIVLNGIALALGLMYFVFAAVSGVVQTAHDGEFLGKRYSSVWLPIRFTVGTLAMVPAVSGWSISQIAMLWMTVMGVGAANLVVDSAISGNKFFAQATKQYDVPAPRAYMAARMLYSANVCMVSINKGIDEYNKQQVESSRIYGSTPELVGDNARIKPLVNENKMRFVTDGGFFDIASPSCGNVKFALEDRSTPVQYLTGKVSANRDDPLFDAKLAGMNQMQSILFQSATKFVNGQSFDDDAVKTAALAYEASIQEGMKKYAASDSTQDQKNKADNILKEGGWIVLGALYQSYATYNSSINNSMGTLPEVSLPDGYNSFDSRYNQPYQLANLQLNIVDRRLAQSVLSRAENGQLENCNWKEGCNNPGRAAIESIKNLANSAGGNSTQFPDPLIGLKNLGDTILITFEAGAAVKAGMELWAGRAEKVAEAAEKVAANSIGGSEGAASSSFLGSMIGKGGETLGLVGNILFFSGIVLSLWVPMIPFVTWISGVISWIALVFESIIAGPLWAMAHLEAEGEGMGQRTTHGYMFAVNLLLRPMLMVFAFIGAWLILTVMGNLVSTLFMIAVDNAQIDEAGGFSVTGGVSVIGFVVIYAIIMLMLVNKSFDLIHVIPDTVSSWIGGHINGSHGRGGEKDVHGMVVGAVSRSQAMQTGGKPKTAPMPKTKDSLKSDD